MKCKLCENQDGNESNTHYLSDSIIRSCLNLDGLNGDKNRAKGFYFDLSNGNAFIEFNFQQNTSIPKLEEALGREATQKEIDKAKQIPFSVDNVFCADCEDIFTEIEISFTDNLLAKFRDVDLTEISELTFSEIKQIRLFFILQVWRSHICEDIFSIPTEIAKKLRVLILNHKTIDETELKKNPLAVTYLETTGEQKEYTSNYVGFTNDSEPNLIFMNDFVIQFFPNKDSVKYFDFYGLNEKENYEDYVNYEEDIFKIKVIENDNRKQLLNSIIKAEKAKQTIAFYQNCFEKIWFFAFGTSPNKYTTQDYLKKIIGNSDFNILNYSKETILEITQEFITKRLK